MMPTQTESYGPLAAQTRRFACDRCHKHKLRCERAPVYADGSLFLLPLGTCKRCEKAGAQCQTTTTATTPGASSNIDSNGAKRKSSPLLDMRDQRGLCPTPQATPPPSVGEHDLLSMFGQSPFSHTMEEPFLFNTDGSASLELEGLESDRSDFHNMMAVTHAQPTGGLMCYQSAAHDSSSLALTESAYDISTVSPAPSVSSSGAMTSRAANTATTPPRSNSPSWSDASSSDQDERKRILDLHALVFDGLHHITDSELAESILSFDGMTPASRGEGSMPKDIIGRVLATSERALEFLDIIGKKLSEPSPRRCKTPANQRPASMTAARFKNNASSAQPSSGYIRRQQPFSSIADGPVERRHQASSTPPPPPLAVSLPVLISFLTCYVGLLSAYRTIFSHIQNMLYAADSGSPAPSDRSAPQAKRTRMLGASSMEDISLNHEQILRIRIQVEVMTHMLDRIGRAWAAFVDGAGGSEYDDEMKSEEDASSGNKAAAMSLLQNMLLHEGFDCRGDGLEIGLSSLETSLERIRHTLRGGRFA